MNLIIEQGNTKIKAAIVENGEIKVLKITDNGDYSEIDALMADYKPVRGIMSSVVKIDFSLIERLRKQLKQFILLDGKTPLPIAIDYNTVDTLGKDRIAAAVGAAFMKPDVNLLIIDAGTAVTFDIVEASGRFIGGNISPGMNMRFKALNHYTAGLPSVSPKDDVPFIGNSTESAISAGVVNGMIFEIDGYIDTVKQKYKDGILVFLTGGDAKYFENRIKNCTFAGENPMIIGLNRILKHNAKDY
ncbi:MAG: type III pantothenate kinase [Tannerella sp.]|jgi:type III pantothenate kinase|nr:type III pantothenate kinase [Tannerella sp.]